MRRISLTLLCAALMGALTACSSAPPEIVHESDLVQHYRTKGIKHCGYDVREKGGLPGAVLLQGEDRTRMIAFLKTKFEGEIDEVLFTLIKATPQSAGQPTLIPVRRDSASYCVVGTGASHEMEPYVGLKKKYGAQLK